jgi:hypothetical protein
MRALPIVRTHGDRKNRRDRKARRGEARDGGRLRRPIMRNVNRQRFSSCVFVSSRIRGAGGMPGFAL